MNQLISLNFICLAGMLLSGPNVSAGTIKTEDRPVAGFTKLDISGSFTIEISQGAQESLKIEADEDVLPDIKSTMKDGELEISMKGKSWHARPVKIYLVFKSLDKISSSGSMVMKSSGTLKFTTLSMDLSGSADINLQVDAGSMVADMSGSSDIKLTGTVNDMKVEISGAGNLQAAELVCQNFNLEISGSGDAKVNVAKELNVDISGSGAVVYKGNPNINKSISGSGSVKKAG